MTLEIRVAGDQDAAPIAAIYAPIVAETATSFEIEPPDADEMARRISATLPGYPYLAAIDEGALQGYAYAGRYRLRKAYDWCAEVSVYVAERARGRGVGRALYRELLELLRQQGYWRLYAGITLPNPASVGLHEAVGFRQVGTYRRQGYKFGRWHDVGWWDLSLQDESKVPAEIIPFEVLRRSRSL